MDAASQASDPAPSTTLATSTFEGIGQDNQSRVVIRFFPQSLSRDPARMQALRGSLQSTVRMRHPNIVPIVGSGLVAGRPYIVMPFVPAGSLKDRFSLGAVSGLDALRSIGEMAAALEYVHSRGMVHGCLRPSKVLFDESGTVQVTGFGEVIPDRVHSPNGSNGAMDPYVAPEVREGRPASRASDQYAFSLMALEMLTGRPAEEAQQALKATADSGKFDRSARPIRSRFNLSPAAAAVLIQGLEKDPAQRFPSVGTMNRALRVAMGIEPPTQPVAKPQPVTQPAKRAPRRFRLSFLAPAIGLALCLLIVVPLALAGRLGIWKTGPSGASPTHSVAAGDGTVPAQLLPPPADEAPSPGEGSPADTVVFASNPTQATTVSRQDPPHAGPTSTPSGAPRNPAPQPTDNPGPSDPAPTAPDAPPPPPPTEAPADHVNPKACKDDPTHPNYCPPTP
jgi:serine/threonine protein kinase